jgi:hypothetical protein
VVIKVQQHAHAVKVVKQLNGLVSRHTLRGTDPLILLRERAVPTGNAAITTNATSRWRP